MPYAHRSGAKCRAKRAATASEPNVNCNPVLTVLCSLTPWDRAQATRQLERPPLPPTSSLFQPPHDHRRAASYCRNVSPRTSYTTQNIQPQWFRPSSLPQTPTSTASYSTTITQGWGTSFSQQQQPSQELPQTTPNIGKSAAVCKPVMQRTAKPTANFVPCHQATQVRVAHSIGVLRAEEDEVNMDQHKNVRVGETGDRQENPLTGSITWHDSDMRKYMSDTAGQGTRGLGALRIGDFYKTVTTCELQKTTDWGSTGHMANHQQTTPGKTPMSCRVTGLSTCQNDLVTQLSTADCNSGTLNGPRRS
ncbi:hypothetical protein PR048_005537 [Dryococelus australis]|uniref:Uncharacterized protein n=1 Tax=Dryococelus australis TaxID=614101 RepID=A0ABQ9I9E2_9NEOP|nr:hypothetical protein PR048_005537 [Dryococelus australis]